MADADSLVCVLRRGALNSAWIAEIPFQLCGSYRSGGLSVLLLELLVKFRTAPRTMVFFAIKMQDTSGVSCELGEMLIWLNWSTIRFLLFSKYFDGDWQLSECMPSLDLAHNIWKRHSLPFFISLKVSVFAFPLVYISIKNEPFTFNFGSVLSLVRFRFSAYSDCYAQPICLVIIFVNSIEKNKNYW